MPPWLNERKNQARKQQRMKIGEMPARMANSKDRRQNSSHPNHDRHLRGPRENVLQRQHRNHDFLRRFFSSPLISSSSF